MSSILIFKHSNPHLPEFPIMWKFQSNDDVMNPVTHTLKHYHTAMHRKGMRIQKIELHVTHADINKTKRKIRGKRIVTKTLKCISSKSF